MTAVDTSKEAIARRIRLREFALQDKALEMAKEGSSNRELGQTLFPNAFEPTKTAIRMIGVAGQRRQLLEHAVPCDIPEELKLTGPEILLLRSVTEVHFEQWHERSASNPDTGWVGRRVRRSKQWAVSCARRRIKAPNDRPRPKTGDAIDPVNPSLVYCSGNGYIGLTPQGWSVAATLFPELFTA